MSPAIVKEKEKQLKEVLGEKASVIDKLSDDDPSQSPYENTDIENSKPRGPISMRKKPQPWDTIEFGTQCSIGYDPMKSVSVNEKENPDAFSKMLRERLKGFDEVDESSLM